MGNRVNVSVNVRDNSRSGIAAVRRAIRRLARDVRASGAEANFQVDLDQMSVRRTRRALRRLQRQFENANETIHIRTQVDQPPPHLLRRFRDNLSQGILSSFEGIFSDGFGQAIANGLRAAMKNPLVATAVATLVATLATGLASLLGAVLSGLLVSALALAFTSIGLASAAMSKEVKDHWKETLKVLKEEFAKVGEPLIPVLERGLDRLEKMAQAAGPKLRQSFIDTQVATEKFINSLVTGFEKFGKEAFDPIMDSWNVFGPVFGEEWEEFMKQLGESFAKMAKLVEEHPTEIAMAFDIVFSTIDLLVDAVTFLGEAWVGLAQTVGDVVGSILKALRMALAGASAAIDVLLMGLESFESILPGINDRIPEIRKNFNQWSEEAIRDLADMENAAFGWDDALNKANRVRKLQADIGTWNSQLAEARKQLSKTANQKAEAKLRANIADLENKIRSARSQLNALNGKTAITYITTYSNTYRSVHDIVGKATGGVVGGRVGRAATGGVRNNMTLVGEHGPELVDLPVGSRVRSNPDTGRLLSSRGSGEGSTIVFQSSGRRADDLLLELLREAIHQRGGDPVTVLGGSR